MSPQAIEAMKLWPVYLVNLRYRADRLAESHAQLERCGWRDLFGWPVTFSAWHGWRLPLPDGSGGPMSGAWGCKRSHEDCLADSIEQDAPGCIVLEDDLCTNRRNWVGDMRRFLAAVPDDWDQVMPGVQAYFNPVTAVNADVVRLNGSNRTHFYIVRDRPGVDFRRALLRHWYANVGHCDHLMGAIQSSFRCYAPRVQLMGQRAGWSDINGSDLGERHWIQGGDRRPLIVLHAPDDVVAELQLRKIINVVRPADLTVGTLGPLVHRAQDDALSAGSVTAVVHPDARAATVSLVTADPVHSVCGNSAAQVLERLTWDVRRAAGLGD